MNLTKLGCVLSLTLMGCGGAGESTITPTLVVHLDGVTHLDAQGLDAEDVENLVASSLSAHFTGNVVIAEHSRAKAWSLAGVRSEETEQENRAGIPDGHMAIVFEPELGAVWTHAVGEKWSAIGTDGLVGTPEAVKANLDHALKVALLQQEGNAPFVYDPNFPNASGEWTPFEAWSTVTPSQDQLADVLFDHASLDPTIGTQQKTGSVHRVAKWLSGLSPAKNLVWVLGLAYEAYDASVTKTAVTSEWTNMVDDNDETLFIGRQYELEGRSELTMQFPSAWTVFMFGTGSDPQNCWAEISLIAGGKTLQSAHFPEDCSSQPWLSCGYTSDFKIRAPWTFLVTPQEAKPNQKTPYSVKTELKCHNMISFGPETYGSDHTTSLEITTDSPLYVAVKDGTDLQSSHGAEVGHTSGAIVDLRTALHTDFLNPDEKLVDTVVYNRAIESHAVVTAPGWRNELLETIDCANFEYGGIDSSGRSGCYQDLLAAAARIESKAENSHKVDDWFWWAYEKNGALSSDDLTDTAHHEFNAVSPMFGSGPTGQNVYRVDWRFGGCHSPETHSCHVMAPDGSTCESTDEVLEWEGEMACYVTGKSWRRTIGTNGPFTAGSEPLNTNLEQFSWWAPCTRSEQAAGNPDLNGSAINVEVADKHDSEFSQYPLGVPPFGMDFCPDGRPTVQFSDPEWEVMDNPQPR